MTGQIFAVALFSSLSTVGTFVTLANRHWRTQIGSLWLGLVLGLTLVSVGLLVANLASLISGSSGEEEAGYFYGVPIAHIAAGVLLVIAGAVTAIHAQAAAQNERRRDAHNQYLKWVDSLSNPTMRSVSLRGIRQLVEEDDHLIAPTWELVRRILIDYLTSYCTEPGCERGKGASGKGRSQEAICQQHPSDQVGIRDALSLLNFCQRALEKRPVAGVKIDAPLDLRSRLLVRPLDLTSTESPPIKFNLKGASLHDKVKLAVRTTHCASSLPVLGRGAELKLVHSGGWPPGTLVDEQESDEPSILAARGEGEVVLAIEGDSAGLEGQVFVDPEAALTLDLSKSTSPTVTLSSVKVGGKCELLAPRSGGAITLRGVADLGEGTLHLGQSPWEGAKLTLDFVSATRVSGRFLQLDNLDMSDGELAIENLAMVGGSLSVRGLGLRRSSASVNLNSVSSDEVRLILSESRIEGDLGYPATCRVVVTGNESASGAVTVDCANLTHAILNFSFPGCAGAYAAVGGKIADGAELNLASPTTEVELSSEWMYSTPDEVTVQTPDGGVWVSVARRLVPQMQGPESLAPSVSELPASEPWVSMPEPEPAPPTSNASLAAPRRTPGRRRESEAG